MLILIGSSFYAVSRVTERLVRRSTRDIVNESIVTEIMKTHLINRHDATDLSQADDMFRDMSESLTDPDVDMKTVTLDESVLRTQIDSELIVDPELIARLRPIAERLKPFQQQLHADGYDEMIRKQNEANSLIPESERLPEQTQAPKHDPDDPFQKELRELTKLKRLGEKGVDFDDVFLNNNQYVFFKPILFNESCINCHGPGYRTEPNGAIVRHEGEAAKNKTPTILFYRYSLPLDEVNTAINSNRAILLATAIITAFLATAALYIIMRYVIVKPLQHLRGVSEEIIEGNMAVRAELNTGDEFEQLSKSFNRMLRYFSDAQSALQSANKNLDKKIDEQARMTMQLFELNQIKSDFLHNMSHELRTPLNSIIGFSEVLGEVELLNEKQKGYANNIRKSGKSLLDLINDILDLAKLEAGKTEVAANEFQLAQVADEVIAMIGKMAGDKRIDLILNVDSDFPKVFQDPIKIRQIFTNLLSNAVKFTPEGGRVKTTITKTSDTQFAIEVEDTGVGISDSDAEIIFEKFRQGNIAAGGNLLTRQHEGTGLGLSIVKELCILLGGSVKVESVLGKGSTFTVTLPIRYEPQPSTQEASTEPSSNGNLIVDSLIESNDESQVTLRNLPNDQVR